MTLELQVLLTVLVPLIGAPILYVLANRFGSKAGWLSLLFPLISALSLFKLGSSSHWATQTVLIEWVPSLNIHLSFLLDGVSYMFGLIVSIMGLLVCLYAVQYLHEPNRETGRFYAYLLLFMTAMLGTVLSNNIINLFIFWELTGIASFLLIGFYFKDEKSQKGARMALLVTGGTGLVLFVGLILLSQVTGLFYISELIQLSATQLSHFSPFLTLPFIFIFIGAMGKSAQFPFHFWLPNAMAAPTPVSAYLHSAAMVKLGIFLVARFYPVFSGLDLWFTLLTTVGFTTMLVGAILAVLSDDLKGLLAHTTISQLGFLIGFYGMGGPSGVEHDYFHILNHVFYKGCLFMVAGIVIHTLHTQDIKKMGGLFKSMPLAGIACILASAAMAGIPLTSGFISKEHMLTTIFHTIEHGHPQGVLFLIALSITAICLIICSLRLIFNVFFGDSVHSKDIHKPSLLFQLPPFILALGTVIFGLFPGKAGDLLHHFSVKGLHLEHMHHLAIWHGVTPELLISASVIIIGIIGYKLANKVNWTFATIPSWFRFDTAFNKSLEIGESVSGTISTGLQNNRPISYLPIIFGFIILVMGCTFLPYTELIVDSFNFESFPKFEILITALIGVFSLGVVIVESRLGRLVSLSVTGLLVSFYFMIFKAPDLALTQLLIESVGLVLILLLISRIPENRTRTLWKTPTFHKIKKAILATGIGGTITILILLVNSDKAPNIGNYFVQHTNDLAGGSNAVNTILVDFRGFDTMGEISVLVIALLGVIGLLSAKGQSDEN